MFSGIPRYGCLYHDKTYRYILRVVANNCIISLGWYSPNATIAGNKKQFKGRLIQLNDLTPMLQQPGMGLSLWHPCLLYATLFSVEIKQGRQITVVSNNKHLLSEPLTPSTECSLDVFLVDCARNHH